MGVHPVATLEVWQRVFSGADFLLDTVASNAGYYYQALACTNETTFYFKVRYRNGATVGPFSAAYRIDVNV